MPRIRRRLLLLATSIATAGFMTVPAVPAFAVGDPQGGGDSALINWGGGGAANGSNGLQALFNSYQPQVFPNVTPGWGTTTWNEGSDWLIWSNAFNFNTVIPDLAIGTDAFNSSAWGGTFTFWTSVSVVGVDGVATTVPNGVNTAPSGSPTGDGSIHIQYVATKSAMNYVVDRYISYAYPNNYWNERIVVTIPPGNSDTVAYWYGGDTTPGEHDSAYGMTSDLPLKSLYSYDPTSDVYISFQEASATSAFDGGRAAGITGIDTDFATSTANGFNVDNTLKDAGTMFQFAFGSTPGTYEREVKVMVGNGGPQVQLSLDKTDMTTSESATLHVNLINFKSSVSSSLGFVLALPAGLNLAGPVDLGTCTASSTSGPGSTNLDVSAISMPAFGSCYIEVPVSGTPGQYVISETDITPSGGLASGYNESPLSITGPALPNTGFDLASPMLLALCFLATGATVLWRRRHVA